MTVTNGNLTLPQPKSGDQYRYFSFEDIDSEFFPTSLETQQLCWVLLSKGKQKVPQLYERARVVSECDEEGRIQVQYPKGSSYRVRRKNLMPVLENEKNLILVASETNDYRRTATVHTLEDDDFIEIGCDFGILVDSVRCKEQLGIDKSEESISIAKERYPNRKFLLGDIFEEEFDLTAHNPSVVAIDINGNRALPAVISCIQVALDAWAPRVIIVKSRELYAKLKE